MLQGGQSYSLKFAAGQLPPAKGFWSLTLYNEEHQFHANAADRYSIGSMSPLSFDSDGSLTITVGPNAPEDSSDPNVNWLPSPSQGKFKLYLRLYEPNLPALESWTPPAVQ